MKVPTKKVLKRWAKMTDDNYHTEVRLEIAKWFENLTSADGYVDGKYVTYAKMFTEILETNERLGSCICYSARNFITNHMIEDIQRVMGENVAEKVNACL